MRAPLLLVAILLLATACDTQERPPPSRTLDGYYAQKLSWSDCGEGFECAEADVPLDYEDPSRGELTLSLIRLPAQDRTRRIGSLFTNPGGPGGSGVDFIRQTGRSFGPDLRQRFDIIGFDPRGVGKSDPVECFKGKRLDRYYSVDSSPDDQQEITALSNESKAFAASCEKEHLPYLGTRSAARDMDVLRAAVGDAKLSYYGASYGTYLGAFYAAQFPGKVRALALDGAVDPDQSATDILIQQAKGFETALDAFAADCAAQDCALGATPDEITGKISDLLTRADRRPLRNTRDSRPVTESWAVMGIATALYVKEYWPVLRQALTSALQSNDGTLLIRLADQLVEREDDGTYSNQTAANMAVNCVDKPNPPSLAAYRRSVQDAAKSSPLFGPFVVWGGLPCVYWPVQTTEKPAPIAAKGAAPILVIGTTRDPATPYQWSKDLASQLSSGVLLTLDGDGHTAYLQNNPCITRATDRYLITGKPPEPGTVCN